MGQACCGERGKAKVHRFQMETKICLSRTKQDLNQSYDDFKLRSKISVENTKFKLQVKKEEQQFNQENLAARVSPRKSKLSFQHELYKFEQSFPLAQIDLAEYELRLKSLVEDEEFINIQQLQESFRDCQPMEDIFKKGSPLYKMMNSDSLKKEVDKAYLRSETRLSLISFDQNQGGGISARATISPQKAERSTSFTMEDQPLQLYVPYLMLLGILYCKATPRQRATVLYQQCQSELTPHVCNKDKELKEYFTKIIKFSTLFIKEVYLSFNEIAPHILRQYDEDEIYIMKLNTLEFNKDKLIENFLDEAFGANTRLETNQFIDNMSLSMQNYLHPPYIRQWMITQINEQYKASRKRSIST